MTDFDYRRYSLNNLENWLHDAMSAGEATPQEIYDTIIGVVRENYECYKQQADQAEELLNLLNNGWTKEEVLKEREYYEPPTTLTLSSCSADDTTPGCVTSWNDFWEEHYYPEEHNTHVTEDGDIYTSKSDKVVKWRLPVEIDGVSGDYYFTLPEDLLEQTGWKENDSLHWIDNNDGSFTIEKVEKSEETEL